MELWPQDSTNRSRPVQCGSAGLCHHLLEQQVRRRREAHGRAGVAVAHLLDRVHRQDPGGVDGPAVDVVPLEGGGQGGLLGQRSSSRWSATGCSQDHSPAGVASTATLSSWPSRLDRARGSSRTPEQLAVHPSVPLLSASHPPPSSRGSPPCPTPARTQPRPPGRRPVTRASRPTPRSPGATWSPPTSG